MLSLFTKDTPAGGVVFLRGNLPLRPENLSHLERLGVELKPADPPREAHWALKMKHPGWGRAVAWCPKEPVGPPPELDFVPRLSDAVKADLRASRSNVLVRAEARHKSVLKDRKSLLRYLSAILGDAGPAVLDGQSQLLWSRADLDDELAHDADLDVESLYCTHVLKPEKEGDNLPWVHTHGLAELGAFDLDLLDVHPDWTTLRGADALRALAFAAIEGDVKPSTAEYPLGRPGMSARTVPADEFMRAADPRWRALRDMPDRSHQKGRAVVCQPGASRLFGLLKRGVEPWRPARRPMPEQGVFHFSNAATEVMAGRARQTIGVLAQMLEETRDFEPVAAVKIGYPTDGGGGGSAEHLWFTLHAVDGDHLDATLDSQPFDIASMKPGHRGRHPVSRLTDWMLVLPFGNATPRSLHVRRLVRARGDDLRRIMALAKAAAGAEA